MVRIQIGEQERNLKENYESWVAQQIAERRADGCNVWVRVTISENGLKMTLSTPGCSSGAPGSGRPPTPAEQEIFQLWEKRGLNDCQFSPGNLISFLKELERSL